MQKAGKYIIFFVVFLFLFGARAEAATFSFFPSSGSFGAGENFTVTILANAEQPINAVGGVLHFPTKYVDVISLNTSNSIVGLWVQNPSFSNASETGNIRFEGVILNPGFTGSGGRIFNAIFRVKKTGSAELNFAEFSILANDGKGTNVATASQPVSYAFVEAKTPAPVPNTEEANSNSNLDKRIDEIENKMNETAKTPVKQVVIVQPAHLSSGMSYLWEVLPYWVKIAILSLVGIATLILSVVFIILGIIIFIWFWNYILSKESKVKKFSKNLSDKLGVMEREVQDDVVFGADELEKEFQYASERHTLKSVLKNYWVLIKRVVKRFFTINNK